MDEAWEKLVEALLDYVNAQEEPVKRFKQEIGEILGLDVEKAEEPSKFSWNPDAVKWEKAQGAMGEFEKSEDVDNPEFKALLKDLAAHGGKLTREGWFYWTYTNGSTVGRKSKVKA